MKIESVLGDNIGYVHMLDHMGDDAEIVRRARVCYQSQEKSTPESDARLLKKLVSSKPLHGTTLRGVVFTFDIVLPLFVMRQWTRSVVGHEYHVAEYVGADSFDISAAYDEQSFRYTEPDKFYNPFAQSNDSNLNSLWIQSQRGMMSCYREIRSQGVDKQLARCFVPQSVYTQMTWTVNAQACLDFLSKRLPGGGAQSETAKYAEAVLRCVRAIIPETVKIWESEGDK